ncbi:DUF1173 family protein [Mycolicibacterium houstonense]|uniref:DUF1173 family protein n=1 Tax=Mycolicibacterium houstonense TaxID=146021 RepID=UPI003F9921B1
MSGIEGWVELAGQRVHLRDVRNHPYRYSRLLAAARASRSAVCLCRPQRLRLVTRCGQGGRYHVACWPHEGPQHDRSCAFFHLEPDLSGRSTYASSAIEESTQGVSIRFALPLLASSANTDSLDESPPSRPGRARRTLGLVGTLHYLWETAGLASWPGGVQARSPRPWAAVAQALSHALADCTISGQAAADAVYVVPPYGPDTADAALRRFDTFIDQLGSAEDRYRRGLLVGEVKTVTQTPHGLRYQLAQQSPRRQLFLSAPLADRLRSAFPAALSTAGRDAGGRCVGLFYVERSRNGYATVIDAALMLTNSVYIPADSSYEVVMADALRAAGRSFVKPLTYDPGGDAVFPDFVLTDESQAFVEVWGLPGRRDYEQRKAAKKAYYQRHAAHLVEWTVTEPLPTLPTAPRPD